MQHNEGARPLEEVYQEVVDAVLERRRAPTTHHVGKLAPRLEALSRAYNSGLVGDVGPDHVREKAPLEARIAFSFARDVPKGGASLRDLIAAGALHAIGERPFRIVDLGAGLGAMTWGIARAIAAAAKRQGQPARPVEALLIDEDAEVLRAATDIADEIASRLGDRAPKVTIRTRQGRVSAAMGVPPADLVMVGQLFSEMDGATEPVARAQRHADLLSSWLRDLVEPDGSLVVVEPALRQRTRHLHAIREQLVAQGVNVFGPCLHAHTCPMLADPTQWCHEDRAIDLPAWLVPLARAAGLRYQGLTFSHLVLRRDAQRLVDAVSAVDASGAPRVRLRVVSDVRVTKGKSELFACTAEGEHQRLRRLDRDAKGEGAAASLVWNALVRGDVVAMRATDLDASGRVVASAAIDVGPSDK
jgi:ribosomal protein RSM22 (predicted rRNA methylase)